ncbi:MAG: class I SAM-dependent RNA methyltransferase [Pseudomonadota bacterium]
MIETVKIQSLGAQGDGVTAEGVFVPGTLPGEVVRISTTGHRARLLDVIEPSLERRTGDEAGAHASGACTMWHASDAFLARWKVDLIAQALESRGINDVQLLPIMTSPPESRRRATFTGRRTKKKIIVGYHTERSEQIVPADTCQALHPAICAALPRFEELVGTGASRKGEMRLAVTSTQEGLDVAVTGGKPVEGPLYGQLVAIAATSDFARLTWDGEPVVTRRPPTVSMGRARVTPPPGGFLQATEHAQYALTDAVLSAVGDARRIADLFAGSGTFALPLAEGAEVHAVEGDQDAVDALDQAWRQTTGLRRVTTEVRDLHRRPVLAREFKNITAVVFDPPRAGARAQCEQIAQTEILRIAAVSCNPATFARDARILIDGGYRLDWVQPIDQFLWTPHVELAAGFSKT